MAYRTWVDVVGAFTGFDNERKNTNSRWHAEILKPVWISFKQTLIVIS